MILVVGSINMDISLQVTSIPKPGETVMSHAVIKSPGGKGANQAIAAAKMGGVVAMLGCVGADEHGNSLLCAMKQAGVNVQNVAMVPSVPTSTAYICVSAAGENSIVVDSSANMCVTPEILYQHEELFVAADYCILQMEIPTVSVRTAIELCRKHNTKVVLNPSPLSYFDPSLLQGIDYLIPNEAEAAALVEKPYSQITDSEFARLMQHWGIQNMLITLGADGVKLFDSKGTISTFPAQKCCAVDTTGAGDTFLGAFVSSIDKGDNIPQAIQAANIAAGISVTRSGAQPSMLSRTEVLERLSKQLKKDVSAGNR